MLGGITHTHMNSDIKAIVDQCPSLTLQVNIGERHRIMRSDIKRGSLWIAPRRHYYSVTSSGEVEALLSHFLHSHFGAETGQDSKGRWKVWDIPDLAGITKLIQRFGERS